MPDRPNVHELRRKLDAHKYEFSHPTLGYERPDPLYEWYAPLYALLEIAEDADAVRARLDGSVQGEEWDIGIAATEWVALCGSLTQLDFRAASPGGPE